MRGCRCDPCALVRPVLDCTRLCVAQARLLALWRQPSRSHIGRAPARGAVQECQTLGIDGRDIRGGLLGLTAELPGLLGNAVDALKSKEVGEAADLYSVFARQCAAGAQAQVWMVLQGSGRVGGGAGVLHLQAGSGQACKIHSVIHSMIHSRGVGSGRGAWRCTTARALHLHHVCSC